MQFVFIFKYIFIIFILLFMYNHKKKSSNNTINENKKIWDASGFDIVIHTLNNDYSS